MSATEHAEVLAKVAELSTQLRDMASKMESNKQDAIHRRELLERDISDMRRDLGEMETELKAATNAIADMKLEQSKWKGMGAAVIAIGAALATIITVLVEYFTGKGP